MGFSTGAKPISLEMLQGFGGHEKLNSHAGIVYALSFHRSCACCFNFYEFICAAI